MILNTRHLRYFVAVAEELNFHRAAVRLHVSQPALWRQIRDLETEIDVVLLNRDPRGISLTRAGEVFLDDCRDILERMTAAQLKARRVAQGEVGVLHIAFNEIAGRRREMPRFLKAFREAYPEISLQLHFLMSQAQIEALRAGTLDAGFLLRHRGERHDFEALRVGHDNFVLAMPREHSLSRKASLRLSDLTDQPLIMPNPRNNGITHEKLVSALRKSGTVPSIAQFADNENAIINLVVAGMGLAFLNSSCRSLDAQGIMLRPLEDLSLPVDLELVWPTKNRNPALAHFTSLVRALSGDADQVEALLETGMG